jgi:hypothetical protein
MVACLRFGGCEQKFLSSKASQRANLRDLLEVYNASLAIERIREALASSIPEGAWGPCLRPRMLQNLIVRLFCARVGCAP